MATPAPIDSIRYLRVVLLAWCRKRTPDLAVTSMKVNKSDLALFVGVFSPRPCGHVSIVGHELAAAAHIVRNLLRSIVIPLSDVLLEPAAAWCAQAPRTLRPILSRPIDDRFARAWCRAADR